MEIYFLKSAACLAFLILFYKLLLEREKMHLFKRFYLLGAVAFSLVIPYITFTTYAKPNPGGLVATITKSVSASTGTLERFDPAALILGIYILGVLFFIAIFIRNLRSIILKIRKNPKLKQEDTINVLLQEEVAPHTFWDYIFLNKNKFEARAIPKEVFEHEQAHARQKHSIDILLIELLQIILWFYPLIYMVRSAIKLNHEFLADEAVLKKGLNRAAYQKTLLSFSSNEFHSNLVHPINYSIIKKRFTVMKTKTSKTGILLRTFLLGPLLLGLLYGFSTTKVIEHPVKSTFQNFQNSIPIQEEVTLEMIEEYNKLAKYYNKYGITREMVNSGPFKRMLYIYSLMNPEQRKSSETLPPPPPPKAEDSPEQTKTRLEQNIPPPPPPPAPAVKKNMEVAPPPPPPSPVEAVQGWIEKGAKFFINGEKVTGQKALEFVNEENGRNIKVQVEKNDSGKIVRLSDNKSK